MAEAARTVNNGNIKASVTNILKCCNGVADTQFGTVKIFGNSKHCET